MSPDDLCERCGHVRRMHSLGCRCMEVTGKSKTHTGSRSCLCREFAEPTDPVAPDAPASPDPAARGKYGSYQEAIAALEAELAATRERLNCSLNYSRALVSNLAQILRVLDFIDDARGANTAVALAEKAAGMISAHEQTRQQLARVTEELAIERVNRRPLTANIRAGLEADILAERAARETAEKKLQEAIQFAIGQTEGVIEGVPPIIAEKDAAIARAEAAEKTGDYFKKLYLEEDGMIDTLCTQACIPEHDHGDALSSTDRVKLLLADRDAQQRRADQAEAERDRNWNSLREVQIAIHGRLETAERQADESQAACEAMRKAFRDSRCSCHEEPEGTDCDYCAERAATLALQPADALRAHGRAVAEEAIGQVVGLLYPGISSKRKAWLVAETFKDIQTAASAPSETRRMIEGGAK